MLNSVVPKQNGFKIYFVFTNTLFWVVWSASSRQNQIILSIFMGNGIFFNEDIFITIYNFCFSILIDKTYMF